VNKLSLVANAIKLLPVSVVEALAAVVAANEKIHTAMKVLIFVFMISCFSCFQ
jgi:hypothetical protein